MDSYGGQVDSPTGWLLATKEMVNSTEDGLAAKLAAAHIVELNSRAESKHRLVESCNP